MSEQEFNLGKWLSAAMEDDSVCTEMKSDIEDWFNYIEQRENIVEQQASEIAALRGAIKCVLQTGKGGCAIEWILEIALKYNLIDEHANPTPLLTGETE